MESTLAEKKRVKRNRHPSNKTKFEKIVLIFVFLLIPVSLLILFTYYPLASMINYSLYDWRMLSASAPTLVAFTAKDNYLKFFTNKEYWSVLLVSLFYLIGSFIQIALALFYAAIFYWKPKGGKFFKGVMFLPSLLNGVAIGLMFLLIFRSSDDGGVINTIIKHVSGANGSENDIKFFSSLFLANTILTFVSIWRYMGNNMVMFAGSMESISKDLFEAAQIDGANRWQQFIHIILPAIKNIIYLNLILAVNGALQVYEIPMIMQPTNSYTQTFIMKTLDVAFVNGKIGLGSAMGICLLLLVVFIAILQKILEKKGDK
jgi:ABC-type sugar transport systems, permease components